jgi:hypothetical protein
MIMKFEGTVTYEDGSTLAVSLSGTPAVAEVVAVPASPSIPVDFSQIPTEPKVETPVV